MSRTKPLKKESESAKPADKDAAESVGTSPEINLLDGQPVEQVSAEADSQPSSATEPTSEPTEQLSTEPSAEPEEQAPAEIPADKSDDTVTTLPPVVPTADSASQAPVTTPPAKHTLRNVIIAVLVLGVLLAVAGVGYYQMVLYQADHTEHEGHMTDMDMSYHQSSNSASPTPTPTPSTIPMSTGGDSDMDMDQSDNKLEPYNPVKDWQTYNSINLGFNLSFMYPSDWSVINQKYNDQDNLTSLYVRDESNATVIIYNPNDSIDCTADHGDDATSAVFGIQDGTYADVPCVDGTYLITLGLKGMPDDLDIQVRTMGTGNEPIIRQILSSTNGIDFAKDAVGD
jgi:hypothetical protein